MRVLFINIGVLLIVANSAVAAEIKTEKVEADAADKTPKDATLVELQALEKTGTLDKTDGLDKIEDMVDLQGDDVNRKKKSATTTFCVEIRPSGEDQRPFQVCEPATDQSKGGYPAQAQPGYYQSQTFGSGGQEQLKPHAAPYQSQTAMGGQSKPAAAFTSPVKTFAAPTSGAANKPYAAHVSYGGYRSNDEDDKDGQMLRTSADSEEDEASSLEDAHARNAYDGYSSGYGLPPAYLPAKHKKHQPHSVHHGQNGLVITCQPSLAGYGHPPILHHGSSLPVPNYSYRSSDGRYGRPYQPYRPQPQPYGSYQHQGSFKPAYQPQPKPGAKPQAPYQQYKPAAYPPAAAPLYPQPAAPAYPQPAAPAYPASAAYPQQAFKEEPAYSQQAFKAQPAYSQQPHAYNAPEYKSQAYPPAPAAEYKPEAYSDYKQPAYAPAPATEYKPQAYSPPAAEYPAAAPAKPAGHNPSYAPVPSPVYVPPGTYREAEMTEEKQPGTKEDDKAEKESHTMHKMEEISEQRAAGGPWGAEIAAEGVKTGVVARPGSWRQAENVEDAAKGARENEVDDQM